MVNSKSCTAGHRTTRMTPVPKNPTHGGYWPTKRSGTTHHESCNLGSTVNWKTSRAWSRATPIWHAFSAYANTFSEAAHKRITREAYNFTLSTSQSPYSFQGASKKEGHSG